MIIRQLRRDARPLYAQTVDALYELINEGAFEAGALLPSEEALAQRLGVSRSTLREAISYLEMDGRLVRRQGVGTYVAAGRDPSVHGGLERLRSFRTLAAAAGRQVETLERHVELLRADESWAALLRVEPGVELVHVACVEALDGCRMASLDNVVLAELVDPAALAAAEGSLLDYLVEATDVPLAFTASELSAVDADDRLAARLQVSPGRSLLHLVETLFTDLGRPVAASSNHFLTTCFSFTITRRIERPRARRAARPDAA